MESINIMCAPGYPASGANGAYTTVHQVKTVAFRRARVAATGLSVTKPIADLPPVLSATTSERST
jgi:hypothetical protein